MVRVRVRVRVRVGVRVGFLSSLSSNFLLPLFAPFVVQIFDNGKF